MVVRPSDRLLGSQCTSRHTPHMCSWSGRAKKRKKGKVYVIVVGVPTEFKMDNKIVPVPSHCWYPSIRGFCYLPSHFLPFSLQVGYQFIRVWADHSVCGQTVRTPDGITFQFRLGRATVMDRKFKKVDCAR